MSIKAVRPSVQTATFTGAPHARQSAALTSTPSIPHWCRSSYCQTTSQTDTQAEGGLATCRLLSWQKTTLETHCPSVSASSFSTWGSGGLGICPENNLFNPVLPLLVKEPGEARPNGLGRICFNSSLTSPSLHCPDQASCLPHRITEICWQQVSQLLQTDVCSGKHLCMPREAAAVVTTPRGLNPGL